MFYKKTANILLMITGTVFLLFIQDNVSAQNLHKEVKVVRAYNPAISDAYKINELPDIKDTVIHKPKFNYTIRPDELPVSYDSRPLKPAEMVSSSIPHLYKSHIRAGMANYTTPMFEAIVNSTRAEDYAWVGLAKHESSFGKVILQNDKKVFAGYHDSRLDLHGKKIFDQSTLNGGINLDNNTVYNYGYHPSLDTSLNKDDIRQNYFSVHANTMYKTTHNDSSKINYNVGADYNFLMDIMDNHENIIDVNGELNRFFSVYKLGMAGRYTVYDRGADSLYNSVVHVNPYVIKTGSLWHVKAGLSVYADQVSGNTTFYPYPVGHLEYHLINNVMIPFVGVDGKLEINSYQKLISENPFITPGLSIEKTNHQLRYYGGMKGSFTSFLNFNFRASYALVDNMYFFVNDNSSILQNTFTVLQDEVEYTNLFFDLYYSDEEKLDLHLKANYHGYGMANLIAPWHKPRFELGLSVNYNIRDKIIVNGDVFSMGRRYAKSYDAERDKITLNGFTDINLGVEYRYTKVLSGFIRTYNLMASRYSYWNQYPTQRFKIMAGLTYVL